MKRFSNFDEPRFTDTEGKYHTKRAELFSKTSVDYACTIPNILMPRQVFARNLARTKLFELSIDVHGSIVECGSHRGDGLGLFYHLTATLEPTNINRKIISFDTFTRFPDVSDKDPDFARKGRLSDVDFDLL